MFQLLANVFQRQPAWVLDRFGAVALLLVQVAPAMRAQTFAVLAANGLYGQCQQNLLPQDILKEQPFSLIIPYLSPGCGHRKLFFVGGVRSLGAIQKLELVAYILMNRLHAACALHLHPRGTLADYRD